MYVCLVFPIADSFWEVSDYGKHLVMVLSPLGTKLIMGQFHSLTAECHPKDGVCLHIEDTCSLLIEDFHLKYNSST